MPSKTNNKSTKKESTKTDLNLEKLNVKKIKIPEKWKYTIDWLEKNFGDCGDRDDIIYKKLRSKDASWDIRDYIEEGGPALLAMARHTNRLIDIIKDENYLEGYDIEQLDSFKERFYRGFRFETFFDKRVDHEDMLYAYNYKLAPDKIVEIIDYMLSITNELQSNYKKIMKFVDYKMEIERSRVFKPDIDLPIDNTKELIESAHLNDKWKNVEIKQTQIKEGIIYILSNPLMPGLVKIGFTAGNPIKRCDAISAQYGLPVSFQLEVYFRTKDPFIVEQKIHSELEDYRVHGEFFKISPKDAEKTVYNNVIP